MKNDNEIKRLLKLKEETPSDCWLSSQMKLNLERAYAVKEEQERIFKLIDKEIKYFDKPNMEFNKAMKFYLTELKRKISQ